MTLREKREKGEVVAAVESDRLSLFSFGQKENREKERASALYQEMGRAGKKADAASLPTLSSLCCEVWYLSASALFDYP